jgi:hypothetical protein
MSEDHPPIHTARGVSYWCEDAKEYILDPTPDMHTPPTAKRVKSTWETTPNPEEG